MAYWSNNEEIKIFQEYLRIPSVHPDIDYEPSIDFVKRQANSLGLPLRVLYPSGDPTKPVIVITWLGSEPHWPSVLLTSHMDVVPVYEERWTHPPFGAEIDAEGRIFARGAQDMKCVATQYLGAVRALQKDGVQQLKRTVHIAFVPDEEIGGGLGMATFTQSQEFKDLNIGFTLDEGCASADDAFNVFYAERTMWQFRFDISGNSGHGSLLLKNTAGEKLVYLMGKINDFRAFESKRLDDSNGRLNIADVTTVNMTILQGGVQSNVVPAMFSVTCDMRMATDVNFEEFEAMLKQWASETGSDIELVFLHKNAFVPPTNLTDSNPFWVAFNETLADDLGYKLMQQVCLATSDLRFIRAAGIPAIGFSPINNSQMLMHGHDEFLDAEVYLNGISIYKKVIANLANVTNSCAVE